MIPLRILSALTIALAVLINPSAAYVQEGQRDRDQEKPIRISTELVQMDVVVTDKSGKLIRGLSKDDFELHENGKKQHISFFEFAEAGQPRRRDDGPEPVQPPGVESGLDQSEVRRILAFVVDDLTIRVEDLGYVRQMLSDFLDVRMRPTDLVAIVRTVGGKGLLQQFTSDKPLLRRAVAALTPVSHALSASENNSLPMVTRAPTAAAGDLQPTDIEDLREAIDIANSADDTNRTLRSYMSLGTASFLLDSMRQLPGRKSLLLISGGLPLLSGQYSSSAGNISHYLNQLADKATRAGVAIHTMDIKGLQGQTGVAKFTDTPARSAIPTTIDEMRTGRPVSGRSTSGSSAQGGARTGFGRTADDSMLGNSNPFDLMEAQMGLRSLAQSTGGLAVLNKNDFGEGLKTILDASEGYYVLAYTPIDAKFNGEFRKVEVKVKTNGVQVYSRSGYIARLEKPLTADSDKLERLLDAIKSPLLKREVGLDAMLLYKGIPPDKGGLDIHLVIDAKRLAADLSGEKQRVEFDIAGFVFDELGKLRGKFGETVSASLNADEYERARNHGLTYSANTTLPAGIYQVRLAVRDNKSGAMGTTSRYLEIPDVSKGRFAASSLLVGPVPASDTKAANPQVTPDRRIARNQDLRYAVIVYNAKPRSGRRVVHTQLMISKNGDVVYQEPEQLLEASAAKSEMIKVGQLGLSRVAPGRYTMTLIITDEHADKKSQTLSRSMDFIVVE